MESLADKMSVAILADSANESVPRTLNAILTSDSNYADASFKVCAHDVLGANNIQEAIQNAGAKVIIAAFGVSDGRHSGYQDAIYRFLKAWKHVEHKPAILMVSHNPEETQRIVDEWFKVNPDFSYLRSAVKVNTNYLVSSNIAGELQTVLDAATEYELPLSRSPERPSDTVRRPIITSGEQRGPSK